MRRCEAIEKCNGEDNVGGTQGSKMEGDKVDSESKYFGEHSPEYRKDGVVGAGRGLEVIRHGMTWAHSNRMRRS